MVNNYSTIPTRYHQKEIETDYNSAFREEDRASIKRTSKMPSNVLGFYTPSTNEETLPEMPNDRNIFVEAHESAHASGISDEFKADCLAAARTGKFQYIRTPIK